MAEDKVGYNGSPIVNGMCGTEWSRDRWRYWPRTVNVVT